MPALANRTVFHSVARSVARPPPESGGAHSPYSYVRRFIPAVLIGVATLAVVLSVGTPDDRSPVARLGAGTAAERDAAARELLALGEDALPDLKAGVESPDLAIRARCRAILELLQAGTDVGSPARRRRAVALVREALDAPGGLAAGGEYAKRFVALLPESGDALADAARAAANRPGTRAIVPSALVAAMGRYATSHALDTLLDLVDSRSIAPSGALYAARELRALRLTDAPARADSAPAGRPTANDLESARLRLAALFSDDSAPRRRAAASLYAALADADSAGPLAALVDDRDAAVRAEVANCLPRLPRLDPRALLVRLATDPAAEVRVAALEGLRDEPRDAVRELALRAAADDSPAVRAAAVPLLAGDRADAARVALARLEVDDSVRVRGAVRRAWTAPRTQPPEIEAKALPAAPAKTSAGAAQ